MIKYARDFPCLAVVVLLCILLLTWNTYQGCSHAFPETTKANIR